MVQPRKFSLMKRAALVQISLRKIEAQNPVAHQPLIASPEPPELLVPQPGEIHVRERSWVRPRQL